MKKGAAVSLIILVGEDIGEANLARLRQAHPDLELRFCPDVDSFLANAAEAEIIFSKRFPPGKRGRDEF